MVAQGHRAMMLYLVQRTDCQAMTMAADIDPTYTQTFAMACKAGVEVLAMDTDISPQGVQLRRLLPVQ